MYSYITKQEFIQRGGFYIDAIDITKNGKFSIIEGTKEQFFKLFLHLLEKEEGTMGYMDFYYSRINEHNELALYQQCNRKTREVLQQLFLSLRSKSLNDEFVFVEMTRETLYALLCVSFDELLFSSFYYINPTITIWSNYNGRFMVFHYNQDGKNKIMGLANQYELGYEE